MKKKEVTKWTKNIPICPYCNEPTWRMEGLSTTTLMYFEPIYDEEGNNINPDRNTGSTRWHCMGCGKDYTINSK